MSSECSIQILGFSLCHEALISFWIALARFHGADNIYLESVVVSEVLFEERKQFFEVVDKLCVHVSVLCLVQ